MIFTKINNIIFIKNLELLLYFFQVYETFLRFTKKNKNYWKITLCVAANSNLF